MGSSSAPSRSALLFLALIIPSDEKQNDEHQHNGANHNACTEDSVLCELGQMVQLLLHRRSNSLLFRLGLCLHSLFLLLIFVIGTSKADTFTFVPDGRPLTIYVDEEPPSVVQCALTMFCDDYKCVFGDSPQRANRDKADIIVECSENGEWEHFDISVSRQGRLHVKGSDPRGTAYGILELSRLIGISPWVWWADVPPE